MVRGGMPPPMEEIFVQNEEFSVKEEDFVDKIVASQQFET